jgi:transposase-like protein
MAVRMQDRFSVEFRLQIVRTYLAGQRELKGIAGWHDLSHPSRVGSGNTVRGG